MKYYNHKVLGLLSDLEWFYAIIGDHSGDILEGVIATNVFGINYQIYYSFKCTMESIKTLVYMGHLSDAFALCRKYADAIMVDIYKTILVEEEETEFVTSQDLTLQEFRKRSVIRAWTLSEKKFADEKESKLIYKKIKKVDEKLNSVLNIKDNYIPKRNMCNDNVHYNGLMNFELNNPGAMKLEHRIKILDDLFDCITNFLSIHFAYLYILKPHYFSSSDYGDALDCGVTPKEGSQYWVAPIVQNVFDKYIKHNNKELADFLIAKDLMELK